MRRVRVLATLLTAVAAALLLAVPASAAGAIRYAALGDSYASGTGTGQYDPASGSCNRSALAYPSLWSSAHQVASFSFVACSGATTDDLLANQASALRTTTTLVTVSIGGNDVGFGDVVTTCTIGSDQDCANAVQRAETEVRNTLPGKLDRTYAAIHGAAPSARVVVMGYPRLFATGACWLSASKRTTLNDAADLLATTIAGRAAAAHFTFVDGRSAFAGHGICAASPWINGVTWPVSDSYHPNRAGHANGYLPALDAVTG
ncbi:SGNH/GDSL hydrolase family protein [Gandjariella thermophila]|nr:SGNH/GDSL hydrolase family protein [Gandjariella thermophila]